MAGAFFCDAMNPEMSLRARLAERGNLNRYIFIRLRRFRLLRRYAPRNDIRSHWVSRYDKK